MTTSKQGTTTGKPAWLKLDSPQIQQYDVIIGWDSEYRNKEWDKEIAQQTDAANYNDVISYQYAAFSLLDNKYKEGIIYVYDQEKKFFTKKWTLAEIVGKILKELEITIYQCKKKELNVLLVSHFSVAEYTTLRERDKLDSNLSEVQKTLVSFKPFIQKIKWDKHAHYVKVKVNWKDTYLLAPESKRSLRHLAEKIETKKVEINGEYYRNMVSLLEESKNAYEEYAIEDAKITLNYYCYYMSIYYNVITNKLVKIEPLTTSDSTIKYFLKWLEEQSITKFREDKKFLENKILGTERGWRGKVEKIARRKADESIAGYAYMGGLNTFYRLGKYVCKEDEMALDIDLSKAYPSAMATLPAIDWKQKPKTNFTLIEIANIFNNAKIKHSKIGIFLNEFNFPKETYQSSIAQKTEGGLIYTNEGEDFCTWPELTEAVRLGGITTPEMIIRGNLYQELKITNEVYLPFAEYLGHLSKERDKHLKDSFESAYYKLMSNGFYGKLAQGIEHRTVYNLNNEKVQLKPSAITCAHYASQTTGLIRACMEVMINTINNWPGCKVFNATTDGLMITIPKPKDVVIKVNKEGIATTEQSFESLMPELYQELLNYYPIKLLIQGQQNLGMKTSRWLEIKYIGDEVRTEQTRANYIAYKNVTQSIARGNVSGKILISNKEFDHFVDSDKVEEIEIETLVGIRELREKKWDLVQKRIYNKQREKWERYTRTVNIGYDGKRVPTEEGLNSRQPENIEEWEEFRKVALQMKKSKERIRISDYLFRKGIQSEGGKIRIRGSRTETTIRIIVSMIWKHKWAEIKLSYPQLVEKLNQILNREELGSEKLITVNDLKNWKRKIANNKVLPEQEKTDQLLTEISTILGVNLDSKRRAIIINNKY